jgi:putative aldouronate transport system permease protein
VKRNPVLNVLQHWQLYLLVLLPMIAVIIFHYVPLYGVQIAFRDYSAKKGFFRSTWVGLKHFKRFFNYPQFWQIILNSLKINLLGMLAFPLPIILAILFNDLKNGWFKKTTQMLTYAPHFVSTVVLCSMVLLFLNRETGVINVFIRMLGGEGDEWMGKPEWFAPIYVISGLWQNLGWDTVIYLAALASLPLELIDAAKVDGANRLQVVRNIYLPHLAPTIVTLLLLSVGGMLGTSFEKVFLLQNALNKESSSIIATYTYEIGLLKADYSYSTAIGLFNSLVNIVVITTFNTISKKVTKISMW